MTKDVQMTDAIDFAKVFARLSATGVAEETITVGGVHVRMVRVAGGGDGRWDRHNHTAETVVVWSGDFQVEFRDRTIVLSIGQCCVIPIDTEHRGTSNKGAEIVLFTRAF